MFNPRNWDIIGKLRILVVSFITVIIVGALVIGFRWMTSGETNTVAKIVFTQELPGDELTIISDSADALEHLNLENLSISVRTSDVSSGEVDEAGIPKGYNSILNVIEVQASSITDEQYSGTDGVVASLQALYGEINKTGSIEIKEGTTLETRKTSGQPLNWGLDFTGGTIVELTFVNPFAENGVAIDDSTVISEVRAIFAHRGVSVGSIQVQRKSAATEAGVDIANSLLIRTQESSQTKLKRVIDDLHEKFGEEIEGQQRIDTIGPVIGDELKSTALQALLWALAIIFLYIAIRFEPKASVAAIACLIHDLFFVLGVLALFWVEVNLAAVAALLAMISYDVQDTVVIMDRVRENTKLWLGRISYAEMINMSITQTYMRSFNTSITTLFAILVLLFFGGRTILDFTLILFLGLFAGTFSSIYIAAPLLVVWRNASKRFAGAPEETMTLSGATAKKAVDVEVASDKPVKKVRPTAGVVEKKGPPKKKRPGPKSKRK